MLENLYDVLWRLLSNARLRARLLKLIWINAYHRSLVQLLMHSIRSIASNVDSLFEQRIIKRYAAFEFIALKGEIDLRKHFR